MLSDDELEARRAHRFPGGRRTVEHWENWLLTDCTQRPPMPDALLHPVVLFHLPIQAAGTSVGDLFSLAGASPRPGAVTLLGYDWEYLAPIHEDVVFEASGGVQDLRRVRADDGTVRFDDLTFTIDLRDPKGAAVARVTNRWRIRHGEAPSAAEPERGAGEAIPSITVTADPARMKTMAALLRDPYPVHWDPQAATDAGYAGRTVNQGPLNLSYIANAVMAWAGEANLRRLTVAFHGRVLAGDVVTAGATIEEGFETGGEARVRLATFLDRGSERLASGTAEVARA